MSAAALFCVADYRRGLIIIAAAGLLQDLVRKLTPGQPTYLMGLVFVAFAATFAGALVSGTPRWWRRRDWRELQTPLVLFGLVLLVQAMVSYFRVGSFTLIGLGLAAYTGPIVALVLGSWVGSKPALVRSFLHAYLVMVAAMASGIVLYETGFRWPSLMSIGPGLIVYDWQLGAVYLPPGFFRAPEVASWHCAAAACLSIALGAARGASAARWLVLGGLAAFFTWCVVVTGRRKGLGEIVIFLLLFGLLQIWIRGRLGRLGGAVIAAALLGSFAFQRFALQERAAVQIGSMQERTLAGGGAAGRFVGGVRSLPRIVAVAGFFGTGLGTGTQGAQHFRAQSEGWTIISESGLARVVAELGVPGAAVALLLLVSFGTTVRKKLPSIKRLEDADPSIVLGLAAFLGANAVIFISAHQIFGDPFVYIFLGVTAGFVVAALDERERAERRRQRTGELRTGAL